MSLRFWLTLLFLPPLLFWLPLPVWLLGLFILAWALFALYTMVFKIIIPIDQVKEAALNIASGHFEEIVNISSPQEMAEISSALQTLRECLMEADEASHQPTKKLYGEYECAELLQYEMLDKVMEHSKYEMKKASLPSSSPLALRLLLTDDTVELLEAEVPGFPGTYRLLTEGSKKRIKIHLTKGVAEVSGLPEPLLWSTSEKKLRPYLSPKPGDILIVYNNGLAKQLPHPQSLKDWLTKILKHFAKDGLSLTSAMMQSELNFFAKKTLHHEDLHILLIQYFVG